ncbi:hypothetical protein Sjap_010687 [Stephania japonica]|uniref:Protein kinase domain-containing protein n=1 Tax=Stephania japonica TaxID=461633 RepID=A0AAP0JBP7_9MAGN
MFLNSKIRLDDSFDYKSGNSSKWCSLSERTCEKSSPRVVLDGPEERSASTVEDYLSLEGSNCTESSSLASKGRGSRIWKSISNIRLIFPFLASPFHGTGSMRSTSFSIIKENVKPSWRCYSYEEISNATNNFHPDNLVGRGGFAEVFKGDLQDGQTIAVKRLVKSNTDENKHKEFLTELGIVVHICHPNTAYLIGCCIENGFHLIFKFSPNGNLATALHGKQHGSSSTPLKWSVRHNIVVGVARGLHYLHKHCKRRIIHRDIKAANILLGPDFEPQFDSIKLHPLQISDFGLAKWLPKQWTHHSVIPIEGTFGYLAPEYFMHGIVDEKTDVFAFGVLILEIITGRRPVDSSKQSLLYWAKPLIDSNNIIELADPKLAQNYDMDQMRRLVLTASFCIRQSSLWRPSMSEVLQLLTDGQDSEVAKTWRMPETTVDEMDDYTEDVDSRFSTNKIFQD